MARDPAVYGDHLERLGAALIEAGFPRMPARVFAALLSSEDGRLTAAELADQLRASPAAISGAVRYLSQVGLAAREREPGTRRDRYRILDDIWRTTMVRRDQPMLRIEAALAEGVEVVGRDTAAGRRMTEALDFFEFLRQEMPLILERWLATRAATGRPSR